jgi:hypothetical protein
MFRVGGMHHFADLPGSGLDARYMISKLRPTRFKVLSLTTVATPHRGRQAHNRAVRIFH